ncbi:hypothetical protein T4B_13559 [Trichinella pseudospiralis]|uniref:Uncharacterized protein n=1 Tax=Trichinella pseudospiralis TaxID=6337 RepID=A0A0V1GKJ5_TRIPS|nr:hypothetical protein T4B_13559 [Trichinella pseudospiralis]
MHGGAVSFFKNIARSMQPGKAGIISLYLENYSKSINTHYVHICEKSFSSKISKFSEVYRFASFAKNGEKVVFKIWTFFDCNIFILLNYNILESLSENNPVAVE